jgi:hypothetical protein
MIPSINAHRPAAGAGKAQSCKENQNKTRVLFKIFAPLSLGGFALMFDLKKFTNA